MIFGLDRHRRKGGAIETGQEICQILSTSNLTGAHRDHLQGRVDLGSRQSL